jgi:hypothetical protein
MRRTIALACTLAVLLGGCAGDGDPQKPLRTFEPQNTASSPSPKVEKADEVACTLLTSKERRSIAGMKLDIVAPQRVNKEIHRCRWVESLAAPLPRAIEVAVQRTEVWLKQVPRRIDVITQTGGAEGKMLHRLQAAKKDVLRGVDKVDDEEACKIFSLLIEARFDKKGLNQYYALQDENTAAVTRCANGIHTSVSYSERGLESSVPLSEALQRIAKLVHQRARKQI